MLFRCCFFLTSLSSTFAWLAVSYTGPYSIFPRGTLSGYHYQQEDGIGTSATRSGTSRACSSGVSQSVHRAVSPKAAAWFESGGGVDIPASSISLEKRKATLLQLGASLDRGQAYNPTSGEYYRDRMEKAVQVISDFITSNPNFVPESLEDIIGEWELILTTVPHGIFRSSPFFLAIQEAYEVYADEKESFGQRKAELFFKLHELQTCSWGVSKVGRVAQYITKDGYLYSTFDTSIFSLTVIPILGWFKLLPTFGGCVVTAARAELKPGGELAMVVDYTTARPVDGLSGLGEWLWNIRVPVGAIWRLLPWNKGRDPTCRVYVRYVDRDFRIVQDISGEYFVYTRPVVRRVLDLDSEATSNIKA